MKRIIIWYGLALAILVFLLKFLEYRYIVRDLSLEFYLGVIAILFTTVGIWLGLKLTRKKVITISVPASSPNTIFQLDEQILQQKGISKREYEVLELMAKGHSNQEIADKLFVSLNTIKTHTSNLFIKLEAKRRTQAIERAKQLRLLP
ncbi:helix-turn-helix transcriptional regulator [Ohtaekwangia koreensis]|uniref:helix-turn-helix transcriptional regulator n=1 Tax=Ohtaekwangia koreensis TaxID=688867 RepID=UPI001FEAA1F9|nr:LuxR C-terminal-related transcriptional regulator [Ohtaekwangia koreensis]